MGCGRPLYAMTVYTGGLSHIDLIDRIVEEQAQRDVQRALRRVGTQYDIGGLQQLLEDDMFSPQMFSPDTKLEDYHSDGVESATVRGGCGISSACCGWGAAAGGSTLAATRLS